MPIPGGRQAILAAAALLAAGFGGGYVTARLMGPHAESSTAPQAAPAASAFDWPFFGKPRAADAPRAAVQKPAGFAVWTTRLDTAGGSPRACIRMSMALDPG